MGKKAFRINVDKRLTSLKNDDVRNLNYSNDHNKKINQWSSMKF